MQVPQIKKVYMNKPDGQQAEKHRVFIKEDTGEFARAEDWVLTKHISKKKKKKERKKRKRNRKSNELCPFLPFRRAVQKLNPFCVLCLPFSGAGD
jgi:hypothetical protein